MENYSKYSWEMKNNVKRTKRTKRVCEGTGYKKFDGTR